MKKKQRAVVRKKLHVVKYVPNNGHSDQFECSCGWKSQAYWDLEEAAWDEWLVHAHDVGVFVEPRDLERQKRRIAERDEHLKSLKARRDSIDRQIKRETPRHKEARDATRRR